MSPGAPRFSSFRCSGEQSRKDKGPGCCPKPPQSATPYVHTLLAAITLFGEEPRRLTWNEVMTDSEKQKYNSEGSKIALISRSRTIREIQCSEYVTAGRFSSATGVIYISGMSGLDIVSPETSEWLYTMRT